MGCDKDEFLGVVFFSEYIVFIICVFVIGGVKVDCICLYCCGIDIGNFYFVENFFFLFFLSFIKV